MNKCTTALGVGLLALIVACFLMLFRREPVSAQVQNPPAILVQAPPPQAQSAVVTSVSEPVQFQVSVPDIASANKVQKGSKRCRIIIESRVEDAQKMSAFFVRGQTYYLRAQGARGQ